MSRTSLRRRAKESLRRIAVELCGHLLRVGSKPYTLSEAATVVIAPHQDDESLACGGIIARKRNEGLPVHVVFITDGSASHPGHARLSPPELAKVRRDEAMRAMACLGVERPAVHFLDESDGTLGRISDARRDDLIARLGKLLATIGPAEIFLPCNPDGSSEHDATFGFVLTAVRQAQLHPAVWLYPVWSWWNPALLVRRWLATKDCRALPLEDYAAAKREAIACYQSQIAPLAPDTHPSLPPELVDLFMTDTEFFFRLEGSEAP
jgi:LmbE family N-acetylglucosaminyl deacetylase